MPAVTLQITDNIAFITLNRPEVLNAINHEMRSSLRAMLQEMEADARVLALVITGAGDRAFCTGADLREMSGSGLSNDLLYGGDALPPMKKPLIAAIRGHCVAAGLELALQCDIRLASDDARFGLPEAKWGLLAGYGLHHLSRMIPVGEAMYMHLTGATISAQRAHEIGLVQSVVRADELQAAAAAIAERIAANSPRAVQAIKHIVGNFRHLPVEQAMQRAEPIERQVYESGDYKEGAAAFSEKRAPKWGGG